MGKFYSGQNNSVFKMAELKLRELRGHPDRAILSRASDCLRKVQRLSLKGVRPSGRKRAALIENE